MSCGDHKSSSADSITSVAVDSSSVSRVVGNALLVLGVLGVAEEDTALDLVHDLGVELGDSGGSQGSSLTNEKISNMFMRKGRIFSPVSTGDNGSVGTLLVSHVVQTDSLVDGF